MVMFVAASTAIIAGQNYRNLSELEVIEERLRVGFIIKLKGYIRDNTRFIKKSERFLQVFPRDEQFECLVKDTEKLIKKQVTELIKQVKEHNQTDAKRKKIQRTLWLAKLSTKQRIIAKMGFLKQPMVKSVK